MHSTIAAKTKPPRTDLAKGASTRKIKREQLMRVSEQGADVDLEELEASVRVHVEDLTEQRARLSLDSLSDPAVVGELERVEVALQDAQSELERIELARGERGRRQTAATEQAEAERIARARVEADRLQGVRDHLGQSVDAAAQQLAEAISAYLEVAGEQASCRRALGLPPFMDPAPGIEAAVIFALRRSGADRAFGRLAAVHARPLAGEKPNNERK